MNVRQLDAAIHALAVNGRGTKFPVIVICDGRERRIRKVEIRAVQSPKRRPRDVIVLLVADLPAA